jgi:hypothetical protein
MSIRAGIDGRSRLLIQSNQIWWHHIDYSAPGTHNDALGPTIVNGFSWTPIWPVPDEAIDCDCFSSKLDLTLAGIQLSNDNELIEMRLIQVRDTAEIIQMPSSSNDFETVIEFDDNAMFSADWYEVVLVFEKPISGDEEDAGHIPVILDLLLGDDPKADQ